MRRAASWRRLLLAALCLFSLPALGASDERQAQQQLDAIGEQIQTANRDLEATQQARDEAIDALRNVEMARTETQQQLEEARAEREALRQEIADLEADRRNLQAEYEAQQASLGDQVAALYRLGKTPQLKLLLNQDDPARLDRLQTYLNRLAEARRLQLDRLDSLDRQLADNRQALDAGAQRQEQLAAELETRRADLESQAQERQALIARLEKRYATKESRLAALDQDRNQAERLLRQIRERLARLDQPPPSTAFGETRGDLPWPARGQLTSTFRQGRGVHRNGLLIRTSEGSEVTAVHAGRVVFANWMRGFGNLMIIDHGDGMMTLYAHLQRFSAKTGQRVSAGQAIGAVGNTGGQPVPGLYFEVRRRGKPIDPLGWIARR